MLDEVKSGHNLNLLLIDTAKKISTEHKELTALIEDTEARAKRIGQLLLDIKPTLQEASVNIKDFCEEFLPFGKSTAYDYIRIAKGKTTLAKENARKYSAAAENTEIKDPKLAMLADKVREHLDEINSSEVGKNILASMSAEHWVNQADFPNLMFFHKFALKEAACARSRNNLCEYEEAMAQAREFEAALGVSEAKIEQFWSVYEDDYRLSKCLTCFWLLVDADTKEGDAKTETQMIATVQLDSTIQQLLVKSIGDLKIMWLCIDLKLYQICRDNGWNYVESDKGNYLDNFTSMIKTLCDRYTPDVVLQALKKQT